MIPAMRSATNTLLNHVLLRSILFQEDGDEPQLWLESLPTSRRSQGAESPDGCALTDEGEAVVGFLDDCIQRCMKSPYRYIEEMHTLMLDGSQDSLAEPTDTPPSPLLMTVVEQLDAKITNRLLSGSDTLALTSFIRQLLFQLSSKQQSLCLLHRIADKIDGSLRTDQLFSQYPILTSAIRREINIMHVSLGKLHDSDLNVSGSPRKAVDDFLNQVADLPIR
jgi:nucleolar pre-ribosomal-associated protein 1